MKRSSVWTMILVVSLLLSPTATAAREIAPDLPPPPDWPIIGTILRWLGFEEMQETDLEFNPNYPEYRLTTVDDARALWENLPPKEGIRVILSQDDANAQLLALVGEIGLLKATEVTFKAGSIIISAAVERSALERRGVELPFFVLGESISGEIEFAIGSTDCRPTLTVRKVRIGAFGVPLRGWVQSEINKNLEQTWLPQVCIERVFLMPGELAIEGYRR